MALIASAVALLVSFVLSAETLQLARHPNQSLGCDVNGVLSCSTVAQSWQSEFIAIAGLSFPNAFFGIAAESVFVTVAVIGLARVRLPRWFAIATWFGAAAALAYSYWLFTQSMFVIKALCPWCLLLMFSTTVQFLAFSHASVSVQDLGSRTPRLRSFYRLGYDLMLAAIWILAVVALIVVTYGGALLG